jgi:hypothetical protein
MTTHYVPQGEGLNVKPHLLIVTIDAWFAGGVKWTVQCPYEGPRECGLLEECTGSPADVKQWGCELRPEIPDVRPVPNGKGGFKYLLEDQAKWEAYEKALDDWRNVVHSGYEGHRTEECWFVHISKVSDYFEPEYFLADIPEGTPVNGPLKVLVAYEGSGEDTMPKFKLWKEPSNADS